MLQALRDAQLGLRPHQTIPAVPGWTTSLVKRLRLEKTLEGHDGCVNTVHFSPDGQLLVSGSDDMQIKLWDWQLGIQTLSYSSGHHNNVFQARIMPHSGNGTVVSCAADGLVRVGCIPPGAGGASVETRRLACHRGRAHKLALEPDSASCFLSCGEDGEVRQFDLREPAGGARRLLACRSNRGRLELNSVHCRPGSTQFCVAGGDPFVRVYDLRRVGPSNLPVVEPVRRLAPWHLRSRRSLVTITCAVFGQRGEVLATYNDENIYLFRAEDPAGAAANCSAAAQQHDQEARRRSSGGGSSGSQHTHKRPRRGSGGSEAVAQQDTGVGTPPRRAAAAAALAQAERQRAASGAAAAAEAHASMRRGLEREDEEAGAGQGFIGPPLPPAQAAAAAAGAPAGPPARSPDAAWLGRLPPPRDTGAQQQDAAAPQRRHLRQQKPEEEGEVRERAAGAVAEGAGPAAAGPAGSAGAMDVATNSSGSKRESENEGGQESSSSASSSEAGEAQDASSSESEGAGEEAPQSSTSQEEEWDGEGSPPLWLGGGGEEGIEVEIEEDSEEEGEGEDDDEFEDEGELPQGALVDEPGASLPSSSAQEPGEGEHASDCVLQQYKGHRNYRTVKGVSFLGQHDEFVMSGSDCGHVYIWDRATGAVQAMLKGDADTVNCLEPHPHHLLTMATSGIEDTIKLWAPSAEEPQVIGPAQERVMAANERSQGEDRRIFLTPQMLQVLLRARGLGALAGSDSEGEDGSEGSEGSGGEGGRRRRLHAGDCVVM